MITHRSPSGSAGRLWLSYCVFIVIVTTAPFRFTRDPQIVNMKIARISVNPLIDPWTGRIVAPLGVVLNILFFVPFGLLGRRSTAANPMALALLGFCLSISVETAQVFTRERIPASPDVVANTAGALAGAIASGRVDRRGRSTPDSSAIRRRQ